MLIHENSKKEDVWKAVRELQEWARWHEMESTEVTPSKPKEIRPEAPVASPKAEWSNAEQQAREWEPDKFKPDLYFTDTRGIRMTIAKGEVPREILIKHGYLKEEDDVKESAEGTE